MRETEFQTLHRKVQKGEEVTQFREWKETPQSQSEEAKKWLDEPGDSDRGQTLSGPVRGQVRELGLDFRGHGGS